ncbi:MAG TPA: GntR family transcriptional regulator [Actinomycetota bacterium]|jgi:GntR family transcriptional regulator|nr:GntR family transcriptional regulator [Actinomycetota bacterium]
MKTRERRGLWSSVREELAQRIASGKMPPGYQLPPEPELATDFGVSRATLREALRSLEEDGFLTRTRGAGTFVTHRPRLRNNLDVNFGVTDAIRAAGMEPGSEAIQVIERPASPEVARRLAILHGAPTVAVERVRTADGRPVVYSRDIMPRPAVDRSDLVERISGRSIYEYLERDRGIVVHHGVASFRPIKADRTVAGRLRVIKGALLLYIRQVDYDDQGRPVLLSDEYHLADAFEFTVVRRGPGRRFG